MVNIWKKTVWFLALAGVLGGCLPTQQQAVIDRDLDEMKRRLAFVERRITSENLDIKDETGRSLTSLTKRQADMEANMDNLRVELQSFQGRLEDQNRENSFLREELSLMRDELSLKTADLEDRVGGFETHKKTSKKPAPALKTAVKKKPEDLYKEGLVLIRDKNKFAEGRAVFQDFLRRYPDNHLVPNATYWVGESYYGEKQYENAILQFEDVIQKYPKHSKAASSLLKQAFAFHAMGDVNSARGLLEKLIQTYPKSEEAGKATQKLAKWKA